MSRLAILLEAQAEALIQRWAQHLAPRADLAGRSDLELRGHLLQLLHELREALRAGPAPTVSAAAQAHALQRAALGFEVEAVVREHELLRGVIFDVVEAEGIALTLAEIRVLTDFLALALAEGIRAHDRRRAGEAQLQRVIDALPVLVSFVTADERYGLVNKAYEEWFGIPREALLGRTLLEVIGEAAYAKLGPHVRRGLAGERFDFEQHGVPYRHGGTRDVKVSFIPQRDAAGAVAGYTAVLEDITSQRRLVAERERLTDQRTEVLESMGDGFFVVDPEWRITLVNERFEQITRTSREDTLGRVLWELFPDTANPASHYYQSYHRCMAERVAVQFVDYYPPIDLWTDVRAYPSTDGNISVFFRDVSSEQRAAEGLRRQAEFEQQLIGIVSHDLRNPLNVIALSATILSESEGLGPDAIPFVDRIRTSVDRAARLVRDLLDFTQARLGGGLRVDPRPADLHALVRSVVEEVEAASHDRSIELLPTGDGRGTWDPDRLEQVVQNLVTNAVKYSPAGTPIQVTTRAETDEVTLLVHNHNAGAPIPEERLPVLFEPFERAVNQPDQLSHSVGLGLYIVRQIVEAHGGTVEVRSTADEGTTFAVKLPRAAPRASSR